MQDENRRVKINSDNAPEIISQYVLNLINIFELNFISNEDEWQESLEQKQSSLIDKIILQLKKSNCMVRERLFLSNSCFNNRVVKIEGSAPYWSWPYYYAMAIDLNEQRNTGYLFCSSAEYEGDHLQHIDFNSLKYCTHLMLSAKNDPDFYATLKCLPSLTFFPHLKWLCIYREESCAFLEF